MRHVVVPLFRMYFKQLVADRADLPGLWTDVNLALTVFLLATAIPYSSNVQQPMRAPAVQGKHPHTHHAVLFDRKQGRARSLRPEG
jgi:hypothetical protein